MYNESSSASPTLLASNALGWAVFQQPDGQLQLDLGRSAMLFNPVQFQTFGWLLQACEGLDVTGYNGELAKAGTNRFVYYCACHQYYVVMFDQTVLRFRAAEFEALAELYEQTELPAANVASDRTVDYLTLIRPAHNRN
jgi:hypothetical protein